MVHNVSTALILDPQHSLISRAESRVIPPDFSSIFDLINQKALLYELIMDTGGLDSNILEEKFVSSSNQSVSFDGHLSYFKLVILGVLFQPISTLSHLWNNLKEIIISS